MSYITVRGRWCDMLLNVHAPNEDKSDVTKVSFTRDQSVNSIGSRNTT
jgi:hypothetical protein